MLSEPKGCISRPNRASRRPTHSEIIIDRMPVTKETSIRNNPSTYLNKHNYVTQAVNKASEFFKSADYHPDLGI